METANPLRILFVEDLPSDAILAEREIRKSGLEFSSLRVDTKDAFMKAWEEFRPDIVVSDYSMPGFDGMQALKLALEYDSRIPFILLTGSVNEETAVDCMKAGAWDYVIKEHRTRLPFAVKDALEQRSIRQARYDAERKMHESEEQYRILVDNANEAIVVVQDGLIKFVNHNATELTGYTERELTSRPFMEFVHPDDRNMVIENHEKRVKGQPVPTRYSFRVLTLEGNVRWVETSAARLVWQGEPATLNFLTDITERTLVEEELRQSEERFRLIAENAADLIAVLDLEGRRTYSSPSYRSILGDPDLLRGTDSFQEIHPEDREKIRRIFLKTVRTGIGQRTEYRFLLRDGSIRYIESQGSVIRDKNGNTNKVVVVSREVTERKQAEETIALLAHTLKSISECVSITDLNDTVLFVNAAFLKTYGYDEHEVLGEKIRIVGSPNNPPEIVRRINAETQGGGWHGELLNRKKDGSEFPVSLSTSFVRDDSGQPIALVGVAADITGRKQAEQALIESETKYRTLVTQSPDGIFIADLSGTFLSVNKAMCDNLKYSEEEFLSMKIWDIVPQQYLALHKNRLAAVSKAETAKESAEYEVKGKDGIVHFVEVLSAPYYKDKEIVGFQGIARDTTERNDAERNLRLSEERFRSVWDNSADGMRLTDREGRIVDVNPAFCSLVRKSREELLGKPLSVTYQSKGPDDNLDLYHRRFDARETISNLVGPAKLWNGESLDLDVSSSYIETAGQERFLLSILRDVTEQKVLEKRLNEERALLRTIIDAIPDEICVKDIGRKFVLVNPGTLKALNKSSAEIIGKRDEDLIPEKFALLAREDEELVLNSGLPHLNKVGDSRINPLSGEIERSILISKIPLKDSSGKVVGLVGINRDITEVQRAYAALEKERTLLLTLIESIPDEIYLKDIGHRFIVVNSGIVGAIGARSIRDMMGKTDFDFMSPELAQAYFDEEDAILESGQPIINLEKTDLNPTTGEIEKCKLTTKILVRDSSGKKIGILVVNRNITERKKAEEALRASEEKFRVLFEESKDVVYVSTADGKLLDINPAGIELFGYGSKEEFSQVDLTMGYADPGMKQRFDFQMEQHGFVKDFEVTFKRADGKNVLVLETATAVRDQNGKIVQYRGIMRDVTKQRQLEAQFIQAQKMESVGTLAGGIAHDFNNILGIVLGHLALLERTRENKAQFDESIFSINRAVERGASLVRQILTFARRSETEIEPVNINSVIKELTKMLEETFPKTIEIRQKLENAVPVVLLDQTQLHQAILNLCVNARDAMNGQGTITLATRVVPCREVLPQFPNATAHHYVRVSVQDTGTGMDEETRQHIFEPFFTTKEKGKGTGLGLAVVYGVLQAHSGFIDVESAPGVGTTFHLFFPVPEGIITASEKQQGPQEDLPRGTETILVVEDEDILRDLLVKLLEMQGYTVIPSCDGEEAFMRFSEHADEIDLVFSDLGLPKRSGWDAFRMMQKINSKVRLLLASGYIEPAQKLEILKSDAVRFIQKPFKIEEVVGAVRETLDSRREPQWKKP